MKFMQLINKQEKIMTKKNLQIYHTKIRNSSNIYIIRYLVSFLHYIFNEGRHDMYDSEYIQVKNKFEIMLSYAFDNGFQIEIIHPTSGYLFERRYYKQNQRGIVALLKFVYKFLLENKNILSPHSPIQITPIDIDYLLKAKVLDI
jgi:hypothetical protein